MNGPTHDKTNETISTENEGSFRPVRNFCQIIVLAVHALVRQGLSIA